MMLTKHKYWGFKTYGSSKLATLMLARELGRKLEGSEVTVCAVDPGMVAS